ncbi:MAG: UbiD family decarboxylase [Proteobacteria bacterium]|nr:UbiD family decarboxylase [Pseudomonadota bacterium]
MADGLRSFIETLDAGGRLLRVTREVDPKFELSAVVQAIQRERNLPVLFERVRGTRFRVVSNVLGNYAIIADLMGVPQAEVARRWAALTAGTGSVPTAPGGDAAPALEEVRLFEIPSLTYAEKDAGPYLTASVIVARDPDTGTANLSYHRMQMVSDGELRCRLSPSGDLFRIQQKLEKRGEPLACAVLLGLPPALAMAAGATIGPETSEYDLAARITGQGIALREVGPTKLPAPRSTEFVIEGELLPGVRRPEGPFGEWMDYYTPVMDNHVFAIRRVLARKDAIFHAIVAGSTEEIAITAVPIAGSIFTAVRTWVSSVIDVVSYPALQFCVIRMKKQFEGQPRRAILAAFGAEMNRTLFCVAVDEDVNIHDWRDVLWAMGTRCRPDTNTFTIPGVPSFARDPHKVHWGRLGIDATRPLEHAADFERKRTPGIETVKLEDYL